MELKLVYSNENNDPDNVLIVPFMELKLKRI